MISDPAHVREWWPDEADYPAVPGGAGRIGFGTGPDDMNWVQFQVVDAVPSTLFSFRWTHAVGEAPTQGNSFLVVFELEPADGGTLLKMTETGFREMGWEVALLEQQYQDHVTGWDFYLPRLTAYVATLKSRP